MRRPVSYLIAWAVATAVTAGVAWLAISSVMIATAPAQSRPLSATELHGAAPTTPPATTPPATTPQSSATAGPATAPSLTSQSRSSPPDTWVPSASGFGRTFHTLGGDVVSWVASGDVQIMSVTPRAGYQVNLTRYGPDSVLVSFLGDHKTSRVWVRWWDGPNAEVTETVS